jgi:hypothetical protein
MELLLLTIDSEDCSIEQLTVDHITITQHNEQFYDHDHVHQTLRLRLRCRRILLPSASSAVLPRAYRSLSFAAQALCFLTFFNMRRTVFGFFISSVSASLDTLVILAYALYLRFKLLAELTRDDESLLLSTRLS